MHDPFESLVELEPQPSRVTLRGFGVAVAVLCVWLSYLAHAHADGRFARAGQNALWAFAVVCAAFAWLRPQWNRPLYTLFAWLSFPIRWSLAWSALGLLFFAVLTPTAIIVRRLRKPPLPAGGSAWLPARPRRGKSSYFEQS